MGDEILVELYADGDQFDADDLERLRLALRREFLEISEVDAVGTVSAGPAPPGSRGLDIAAIGALAVSVQPTLVVLEKVFALLRGWLGRNTSTMRVTVNGQSIELSPTKTQQTALVEAFIASSANPPEDETSATSPRRSTEAPDDLQ